MGINRERQAAGNRRVFEGLPVWASFTMYGVGRGSWRVVSRWVKIGPGRVQCVTDQRCWGVSETAILSGGSVLVPDESAVLVPFLMS